MPALKSPWLVIHVSAAIISGGVVPSGIVPGGNDKTMSVEHPGGSTACILRTDASGVVTGAGMVRTTRKLFDGEIFS